MKFSPVKMKRLLKPTADFTQGPYLILNQRPTEHDEQLRIHKWIQGSAFSAVTERVHSCHLGPRVEPHHLLLVMSLGEFSQILEAGVGSFREPSTSWSGLLATRKPSGSQARISHPGGQKLATPRKPPRREKEENHSFPQFSGAGLTCPACWVCPSDVCPS